MPEKSQTETGSTPSGIVCPRCDQEVTAELVEMPNEYDIVEVAAEQEEGFMPATVDGEFTVVIRCGCDHVELTAGPVQVSSAWDVPEPWRSIFDKEVAENA